MNDQQAYDKVKAHLLKQGRRSLSAGKSCAYRGDGGLMCAVGCLISPEIDVSLCEGSAAETLAVRDALKASAVFASGLLLMDLQDLHDNEAPEVWEEKLGELARRRGLKP